MTAQALPSASLGGATAPQQHLLLRAVSLLVCAFTLLACGGGGTGSAGGGGTVTPPDDFLTEDLRGDWVGILVPDVLGKLPYSFYICCDDTGAPYLGADAKTRDWSMPTVYTYSKVKPDGEFSMIIVDCTNLYTFDGFIDVGRRTISGDYLMLHEGRLEGEGTYSAVLSAPGVFTIADQVAGSWSGTAVNSSGAIRPVDVEIDSVGNIVSYNFDNVAFDTTQSSLTVMLENDTVGRLGSLNMKLLDGAVQSINHLLVDESGTRLGGYGLSDGNEVIFTLTKVN